MKWTQSISAFLLLSPVKYRRFVYQRANGPKLRLGLASCDQLERAELDEADAILGEEKSGIQHNGRDRPATWQGYGQVHPNHFDRGSVETLGASFV